MAAGGIVSEILTGGLLTGVSRVIDSIRGKSPEDAAKLQEILLNHQSEFQLAQLELEKEKLEAGARQDETAGETIRAEITSPDPYVRRARVLPLYIGSIAIFFNYCCLSFVHIWKPFQPIALPDMFWYTYMFAVGGYVGHSLIDRACGGKGGAFSFLGMKAESKGD